MFELSCRAVLYVWVHLERICAMECGWFFCFFYSPEDVYLAVRRGKYFINIVGALMQYLALSFDCMAHITVKYFSVL